MSLECDSGTNILRIYLKSNTIYQISTNLQRVCHDCSTSPGSKLSFMSTNVLLSGKISACCTVSRMEPGPPSQKILLVSVMSCSMLLVATVSNINNLS